MSDLTYEIIKLVNQYKLKTEELTQLQLVDAITQAIKCGDFMIHCIPEQMEFNNNNNEVNINRAQAITYLPYREKQTLQDQNRELLNIMCDLHNGLSIDFEDYIQMELYKKLENTLKEYGEING